MPYIIPWLIGTCILSLLVIILVAILFLRSRRAGKQLEEIVEKRTNELKVQTTTFTTLFDSIPDPIYIKDLNLRYIQCNKSFLDYFGRTKEDVIGKGDEEGLGVSFSKAEEFRRWDRRVILEGNITVVEESVPRADGTIPLIESTKTPLVVDGNVIGVLGIVHDITKHKEIEIKMVSGYKYAKTLNDALAKLTKSQAISLGNLEAAADDLAQEGCIALDTFCVGIWSYIEEENVLECISCYDGYTGKNPVKDKSYMFNRQEYLKLLKSERLIVMNNPEECKQMSVAFERYFSRLCAALDAPIHIDGKLVGVVCVEQVLCDKYPNEREWAIEEQNFASSLADLMALAISSSERRKAREAAETASQTKSAFLANMSHEIRTPMNAILGVTEILIQIESLPAEIEEGLGKIYSSCDLLLGIINDILDFSKIEAGKLDIMPAKYKVANMINDSVHLNMMRINSKPIEFELHVDENVPARLVGDELRIKQILNNLLSNAFKYTDAGKVTLSVASEAIPLLSYLPDHTMSGQVKWAYPDKAGVTLVLSVRDTGHGLTEEQLGKLFEDYSRFNIKKNITVEGTGLGLSITQRLVNLMDGYIQVESELGKGSLFVVRLPQETVDSEVLGKEEVANMRQFRMNYMSLRKWGKISRDPMPYGSVLIVDDVETNLYVAVGLMKLYKLQIDTAMMGQEAIDKVNSGKVYDIIFMDHMMPEMDGIEATKRMRNSGYNAPIVALTANAVAGQADVFLQNGFDEFISKPIDIRQLNSILNKLIRDKQPPEVIEAARKQQAESNDKVLFPQMDLLLLESFIRDANKAVVILEEQCEHANDLRAFTVVVHGIKSSLWNIGESTLAGLALNLEKAGREQDIETIKATAPEFLNSLRALLEKLELKREEYSGINLSVSKEDVENLRNKLLEIQELCTDYNRKGTLAVISDIKSCSKETRDVLDSIMKHVLHSEFEEAQNIAAEYAGSLKLTNTEVT
ncbi:MAG: ATP-binding protein [Treponema sp.]|nr:ATP-binding protein [Treponema sp.]